MSKELKPALSWGDALLKINELSKRISELEAALKAIIKHQEIVAGPGFVGLSVTAAIANKALSEGKGK